MEMKTQLKLAVGPLQYYWSRVEVLQFYESLRDSCADIVYLGETVCSRRHELRLADWLEVAEMLDEAGKKVILSTQVLLESGQDLTTLRKIAENTRYQVEANDMGAVRLMQGRPFIAGPFLNIYNAPTRDFLAGLGAVRWVMPLEMGRDTLGQIQSEGERRIPAEIFSYGKLPLAFSARCFTARNRNIPKDNCQYVCMDHPDGLLMRTKEGQPFLTINGIQTQSALVYTLLDQLHAFGALGAEVVRISPQSRHTLEILSIFRKVMDGTLGLAEANDQLLPLMPEGPCNGYWFGRPGLEMAA